VKAIAIVGSPRKNGNTEILAKHTLKAIEEEGVDTELIRLAGLDIKPCTACMICEKKEWCPIKDDLFPIYTRMKEADAIIFASPVYFGSATPQIKALMDRTGFIALWNGRVFDRKVGGSLAVAGRDSQNFTLAQLDFWFHQVGCFIAGSTGLNVAFGNEKGEVEKDEVGLKVVWNFGKNVAFLVKKLKT